MVATKMAEEIRKVLAEALNALGASVNIIAVEHPDDFSHGEYSTNVAMVYAKELHKKPKDFAEEIVARLRTKLPAGVERAEVAGFGFINFQLSREFFQATIKKVLSLGTDWGKLDTLEGKKVIVEYTQPNPFKPFHIGHLMSNAVGESISRLVEFSGAEVRRVNYQGDIGLHVAKALWGMSERNIKPDDIDGIGQAYAYAHEKYEGDEDVKQQILDINKKGFEEKYGFGELYTDGRRASLEHFEKIYNVLGTTFDYYFFESECEPVGRRLVDEGLEKNIFEQSDGAVIFRGENYGLHTRVFLTKYGTTVYETRDLGLAVLKKQKYPFDLNLTVTAVEQEQYFAVMTKALELLRPEFEGRYKHLAHGMMQLSSGKMSSRQGNVVTGEDLIEEMRTKAYEKMKERELGGEMGAIASSVAVSAIKYAILKQGTGKNIIFDREQSLSFEGDSGPYLQYSHARACSVLRKAQEEGVAISVDRATEESNDMEHLLYRFPEVVERASTLFEPHLVTTYLIELSSAFNSWYAAEQIVDKEGTFSPYKVALTKAFATTMQNGLWLLGIKAPERM
jgi:arginyl-tRNA synthetase